MAESGCLKDGHFQNLQVESGPLVPRYVGVKDISVPTAADASHTLTENDAGLVLITANLDDHPTTVIRLPSPTVSNIGLYYKVIITGTLDGAASIGLAEASTAFLHGPINVVKTTAHYITEEANNVVVLADGTSHQLLDLDQNLPAKGGAPGSILEFYYVSLTKVVVTGTIFVNAEDPTTGASLLNATGWSDL
tara:strand:+ start:214 stop:792 length:579 start_codon:yes stop_codon:yes gene_type:complete